MGRQALTMPMLHSTLIQMPAFTMVPFWRGYDEMVKIEGGKAYKLRQPDRVLREVGAALYMRCRRYYGVRCKVWHVM